MPEATYLPERQTEYWTSRQIEEFFLDAGYSVFTVPLSQAVEHDIPSDFLYIERTTLKIFGLQYKALYHNAHEHWNLEQNQHDTLQKFPWMYYSMSELRHLRDARSALYYARFYKSNFPFRSPLFLGHPPFDPAYRRWGSFFRGFEQCTIGHKVASARDFEAIIGQCREIQRVRELVEQILDIFFVNFEARAILHAPSTVQG